MYGPAAAGPSAGPALITTGEAGPRPEPLRRAALCCSSRLSIDVAPLRRVLLLAPPPWLRELAPDALRRFFLRSATCARQVRAAIWHANEGGRLVRKVRAAI